MQLQGVIIEQQRYLLFRSIRKEVFSSGGTGSHRNIQQMATSVNLIVAVTFCVVMRKQSNIKQNGFLGSQ